MYFKEADYISEKPFALQSGEVLPCVKLRYAIYGELNEKRDNAVLVFHALTGSARIADWWRDIIGDGKPLDTSKYAFICANYIGSCYGSTEPDEIKTLITAHDIVNSQFELLNFLQIKQLKAVIGGSVGGMLALQFAVNYPNFAEKCIALGATPLSPMGLALNHLQREAVSFEGDVSLARQIAMISYKSSELFNARFGRNPNRTGENPAETLQNRFDVAGYLDHQGAKFVERFNPRSYQLITKLMDLFDLSDDEIKKITAQVALVGISSDWLFPANDVKNLAERMKNLGVKSDYYEIVSDDGHDAFLSDIAETSQVLTEILASEKPRKPKNMPRTNSISDVGCAFVLKKSGNTSVIIEQI